MLAGEAVSLTPTEHRTLKILAKNSKNVLTRQVLLEKLWDIDGNFVDEHALSSVLSATVCIEAGLPAGVMPALGIVSGALLGFLSGLIYVAVKLPPIIVSLGVALFYEGMAFAVTKGYGVSFVANRELTGFPGVFNYAALIFAGLLFMIVAFDHTKFGCDYRALVSGQKVAVETGIREAPNAVLCYGIAGGLMGAVGFISATNTGTIQMALNFGSIGVMFTAFLPMFIGPFPSNERVLDTVRKAMDRSGFRVTVYEKEDFSKGIDNVAQFKEKYDLVLYIGNVENASNRTTNRLEWYTFWGQGNNVPWFAHEVPCLFASVGNPYHLLDVPMMRTYVNCYSNNDYMLEALVEKITGKSAFLGKSPVDPFCGREELAY